MAPRSIATLALSALIVGGCAGASAPGDATRGAVFLDVYWEGARACESRFGTLRIDRVEQDGALTLTAAADSRSELRDFTVCYHREVASRVERRRAAGLSVPAGLDLTPSVEID